MKRNLRQRKLLVKVKVLDKKIRRLMMRNKKIPVMIILKTKVYHQIKRLKVDRLVNQLKKPKKPKMKLVRVRNDLSSIFYLIFFRYGRRR
jgi:hypothetical protein